MIRACPSCADGTRWGVNGPTCQPCRTCHGTGEAYTEPDPCPDCEGAGCPECDGPDHRSAL